MTKKRGRRKVIIQKQAFIGIISSVIEVYKKEAYGELIGTVDNNHYIVKNTYTYQTAKRTYVSVSVKTHRENRLNRTLSFFTTSKVIGSFHSHPEGPHYLSKWDAKQIKGTKPEIDVLISIYKTKRLRQWKTNKDLSISGTIGCQFLLKISAFERDKKTKKMVPLKIECPYMERVNKLKLYAQTVC